MTLDPLFILVLWPNASLYSRLSCCYMTCTHCWSFFFFFFRDLFTCRVDWKLCWFPAVYWWSRFSTSGYGGARISKTVAVFPQAILGRNHFLSNLNIKDKHSTDCCCIYFHHLTGCNSTWLIQSEFCLQLALFSSAIVRPPDGPADINLPLWSFPRASSQDKIC